MSDEERDMRNKIHKLEDVLLRSKDFQEQLRIHYVLNGYRKHLQTIMLKSNKCFI